MHNDETIEINLKSLMLCLWYGKYFIVLAFILSLCVSGWTVMKSQPIFMSSVTIEIENQTSSQKGLPQISASLLSSFSSIGDIPNFNSQNSSLVPKIYGNIFLEELIKDSAIKSGVASYCKYSTPGIISLTGLLTYIGVLDPINATDDQKRDAKLICLKKMVDIAQYAHEGIQTQAFTIETKTPSPEFSAILANKIVELFFENEEKQANDQFKKTKKFLAETMAVAQIELVNAKENLEKFLIKNAKILANTEVSSSQRSIYAGKDIYNLSALIKERNSIVDAIETLNVLRNNPDIIVEENVLSSKAHSTSFLSAIRNLVKTGTDGNMSGKLVLQEIDKEIARLGDLLKLLSKSISETKSLASEKLQINEKLSDLKTNFEAQKIYVQGLERTLQSKSFETDARIIENPNKFYSEAKPSIKPVSPNIKLIFITYSVILILASSVAIVIYQSFRRVIFTVSQVERYFNREKVFELPSRKHFNLTSLLMTKESNTSTEIKKFANNISNTKRICFIDITQKNRFSKNDLSDLAVLFFGAMVRKKNRKILCSQMYRRNSSILRPFVGKGAIFEYSKSVPVEAIPDGKLCVLNRDDESRAKKTPPEISQEHQAFDQILYSSNTSDTSIPLLNLVEHCDHYVLLGKAGKVKMDELLRYASNYLFDQKKFLGFLLVK